MTHPSLLSRLRRDRRGVAMLEFAFMAPIFVTLCIGGSELANYITTRMRVSQIALQIADNAARVGNGSKLSAKTVTDADINDLFLGAQLESGKLDLKANGRVILSDVEPTSNAANNSTYRIGWQRCYGDKVHASGYGNAGQTNMAGVGPSGTGKTQATALPDGATMFVEVYYRYKPLISSVWVANNLDIVEVASMAIRDRRDLTTDATLPNGSANPAATHPDGIYKVAGVTPASC